MLTLIWYKRRFRLLRQLAFTCDPRKPHVKLIQGLKGYREAFSVDQETASSPPEVST